MIKFNHRKFKCLHNYIEIDFNGHVYGVGRTNPNSPNFMRRWALTVDDTIYDIRNYIFSWSTYIQDFLYKRGIYWHNWLKDECTRGFECCMHKCETEHEKNFLKSLTRAIEEQIPCLYYKGDENDK